MCYRWHGESLVIDCLIQPKSKSNEVVGTLGDRLKIRIAAPATDGKANKELVKFLAESFEVARGEVVIEAGLGDRRKRVRVNNPQRLIAGIKRA